MNRPWVYFILVTAFVLLEATFLNAVKIFNVKPDIVLVSVIGIGVSLPFTWVLALSCFAGFLLDIFSTGAFGVNILIMCLAAFISRRASRQLYIENKYVVVTLVLVISIVCSIIRKGIGPPLPFGVALRYCIIEVLYTLAACPLVLKIFPSVPDIL